MKREKKGLKRPKVVHLVMPSNRGEIDVRVVFAYHHMVIRFVTEELAKPDGPDYGLYEYNITGAFITDARNRAAEIAIEGQPDRNLPPADYLVMMDDDMVPPSDTIARLLAHNKPIVAPLFHHRRPPFKPVVMEYASTGDKLEYVIVNPEKSLQEVDAVGGGLVCIDVNRTLRKMIRPFFWMAPEYGEDIYFCHKAKQEAKARVFVDTTIDVGHLGDKAVVDRHYAEAARKQLGI